MAAYREQLIANPSWRAGLGWDEHDFTARQRQILELIAQGYREPEICGRLFVSINTVKATTLAIRRKLGANNAAHAVHLAWQRGILSRPEAA